MIDLAATTLVAICTYGPNYSADACLAAQTELAEQCKSATLADQQDCYTILAEMSARMEDATTKSVSMVLYGRPDAGK